MAGGLSPRRFCNVVYAHLIRYADSESREKFDSDLSAPEGGWTLRVVEDGGG